MAKSKVVTFTIQYKVEAEYANLPDVLEKMQEYGEAEITDVAVGSEVKDPWETTDDSCCSPDCACSTPL